MEEDLIWHPDVHELIGIFCRSSDDIPTIPVGLFVSEGT